MVGMFLMAWVYLKVVVYVVGWVIGWGILGLGCT